MSTMLDAPEREIPEADLHAFEHHWQDEADAAYLYRILADAGPDQKKKDIYSRLAEVEDRHVVVWSELMTIHGHAPKTCQPSGRARLLARVGKLFGPGFLLPMLLQEEGREVKAYLDMHRATPVGAPGGGEALTLAKESAEHATTLAGIAGKQGEPWHRTESGGFLRNVVYGFNDGLTANFGLVAGVIGATLTGQKDHAVIVAGVAGAIADALSMGSSGYLAAKIEREELALIYEAKGMDAAHAHDLATRIMGDPALMLQEQVQEELKIGEQTISPFREGWVTGVATAFGAVIPVMPFFFAKGSLAILLSFSISMLSHFLVGAARS